LRAAADSTQAVKSQIAALRAKQEALRGQLEALAQRAAELGAQREEEVATLNTLVMAVERESVQVNLFDAQHDAAQQALEQARAELEQAQAALAAAEAEERLSARFTLFADMRALAARGLDELAAAAEQAGLPLVRGVLANLIRINPDDQKAVEAALGELLGAVVLTSVDPVEGEASLSHLRAWLIEQTSGRLFVLPMHALRLDGKYEADERFLEDQVRQQRARPLREAIQSPDWLAPAMWLLTAYKFITPTLSAARALAAQLPLGGLCVTHDGEVVHPTGALSLPAGARSPIILGAEAVLSELPDHEAIKANLERTRQARERAQRTFELARMELERSARARDSFAHESQQRRRRIQDAHQKINLLEESLAALAGDIEHVEAQIAQIDQEIAEAEASLGQHLAALNDAQQALDAAEAGLREQSQGEWTTLLSTAQAALATASSELRSAESLHRERQAAYAAAQAQRASRAQRLSELKAQLVAAQLSLEQLTAQAAEAESHWHAAEAAIAPLTHDIAALEAQLRELEARQDATERALREQELQLNTLNLELARHNDEIEALYRRALEALAWETDSEEISVATDDQRARVLSSLPSAESLPEDTEARIAQLRAQIKRLGAINHEAQAEYEALNERYQFLTTQCDDLEKASAALQQVIAELNDVMKDTFRRTFEAIADAFQVAFKSLFGGGQARLSLVNGDNLDACGIEIHAQPPGKRPQSLALLSGGERSLTAVALLFAILQVKPTPLCVLDEVDAALDESNVGRFRAMLESLSDRTQFIVITHNRGTIEAASTIYGISMGADGASTTLSLRLEDVK
jgi:chromosome segregation protein